MNLDSPQTYKDLDKQNLAGSIEQLGEQIDQTFSEVSQMELPDSLNNIKNIVFSGMGGSSLGAYVSKSLLRESLNIPFEIINDYYLPSYVNSGTLVVVQSYSGNTEETLSGFNHAVTKGAHIFALSAGGRLEEMAKSAGATYYKINPLHNPSGQPRMAIGYSIFAILTLFSRIGLFDIHDGEVEQILKNTQENNLLWGTSVELSQNKAKELATTMHNKIPVYQAGEHLTGATRAMRNQFLENAKGFVLNYNLPDADHYMLEGLQFPKSLPANTHFVFLNSDLYGERISARVEKTAEIVTENGCGADIISATGATRLQQIINAIQFGAYVALYSAMLNGIDPAPIPWVENFKKKIL